MTASSLVMGTFSIARASSSSAALATSCLGIQALRAPFFSEGHVWEWGECANTSHTKLEMEPFAATRVYGLKRS